MRRPWMLCTLLLALSIFSFSIVVHTPDWWALLVCSLTTRLLDLQPISLSLLAVNSVFVIVHSVLLCFSLWVGLYVGGVCIAVWTWKDEGWRKGVSLHASSPRFEELVKALGLQWVVCLLMWFTKMLSSGFALVREPVFLMIVFPLLLSTYLWQEWERVSDFLGAGSNLEYIYKISAVMGGLFAFGLAIWRGWCHDRQTRTTMQGHITDRFIKASELLGSDQMASRLGGIFMLWRTGKDSPNVDDKRAVLDMLCAFIREPTPDASCDCGKVEGSTEARATREGALETLRNDVRSAVALFEPQPMKALPVPQGYIFDMTGAQLPRVLLRGGNFTNARLVDVNFRMANLEKTNFNSAILSRSDLYCAKLMDSKMVRARLDEANLQSAKLTNVDFSGARLGGANLMNSYLYNANLTGAVFRNANLENAMLLGAFVLSNPRDILSERIPFTRNHCSDANTIEGAVFTGDSSEWPDPWDG